MKATIAVAATALLLALPATAAAPRDPRVPALQRQVTALQGQVAALSAQVRSQVTALQSETAALRQENQHLSDALVCGWALQKDFDGAHWHLTQLVIAALGISPLADLTRMDDQGACQRIGVTR